MVDCSKYSLFIIESDERIRNILKDSFGAIGYRVKSACSVEEAFSKICLEKPDSIISDIVLAALDSSVLFENIENLYPGIKYVLTADCDIDQYFTLVRKYNIGNVLMKGPDFNVDEITGYVQSVLTGSFFRLHHLFSESQIKRISVSSYSQAREVFSEITGSCPHKKGLFLEIAIDELISNAFFHALLDLSGLSRECWFEYSDVKPECAIKVTWAHDEEKVGVSVEDPLGNLKKKDVLKWLDICREEKDIEEHGRGFLLVRRLIDRMIINIDPGNRTECIAVQYYNQEGRKHKPLMINELEAENSLDREKLPS